MPEPRKSRPETGRSARVPDDETMRRITTRAVAEIVPYQEFVDGLRSGRPMRLKMGFDPTVPVITLGWAVGLRKLRQLQDLGHTVVIIIGDWTARIGDPSGESQTRPMLTAEEVQANSQAILRQFYKVLDEPRTEIRRQSEWFDPFTLTDVVRLSAGFTVAQMLQRDDFAQRYAQHKPIGLHELLYPLLQAYDSVAVEADVEFGGTDQKFNNLVGRELQRAVGQNAGPAGEGQAVFLVPLLVGYKGGNKKMSQSLDNYIAVDDPPYEMYGKLMKIPDTLIVDYFELLTDVPDGELADIRKTVSAGGPGARDAKDRLAQTVVEWLHGDAAREAEEDFFSKFRMKVPPDAALIDVGPEGVTLVRVPLSPPRKLHSLPHLIHEAGLAASVSEARALIRQGAVEKIGRILGEAGEAISRQAGERIERSRVTLNDGDVFRVGKHRFLRIVDLPAGRHGADKHPQP